MSFSNPQICSLFSSSLDSSLTRNTFGKYLLFFLCTTLHLLCYRLEDFSAGKVTDPAFYFCVCSPLGTFVFKLNSFIRFDRQLQHICFINIADLSTCQWPAATVSRLMDLYVTSLENDILPSMTVPPFFFLSSLHLSGLFVTYVAVFLHFTWISLYYLHIRNDSYKESHSLYVSFFKSFTSY